MTMRKVIGAAGLAAALLTGSATAWAQDFYYGGPYDEMVPVAPAPQGYYSARRETYFGPYGRAHRRCRPHEACYNRGPSY